jgi:hypothetical protein
MRKLGVTLARMAWSVPENDGQTHHETCYTYHHRCAVERLADEVEMLRGAIAEFARWDRGSHGGRWAKAHKRLHEIADEIKQDER